MAARYRAIKGTRRGRCIQDRILQSSSHRAERLLSAISGATANRGVPARSIVFLTATYGCRISNGRVKAAAGSVQAAAADGGKITQNSIAHPSTDKAEVCTNGIGEKRLPATRNRGS